MTNTSKLALGTAILLIASAGSGFLLGSAFGNVGMYLGLPVGFGIGYFGMSQLLEWYA